MFLKLIQNRFAAKTKPRSRARRLAFERCEDRRLLATMADIVFLVDESSSTDFLPSTEWLRALVTGDVDNDDVLDPGEKSLATTLGEQGIDDVRYGLVGFGESLAGNPPTPRHAHSQLFDDNFRELGRKFRRRAVCSVYGCAA